MKAPDKSSLIANALSIAASIFIPGKRRQLLEQSEPTKEEKREYYARKLKRKAQRAARKKNR